MYKLYPYFTNDGSVGLFSPDADDIYHSTYGALTEAYEKFILPAEFEKYFAKHDEIKILDICFGIGYNTKSFLNYFLEKILSKKTNTKNIKNMSIEKIDTDKIKYAATIDGDNKYTSEIYTDNTNCKNTSSDIASTCNTIQKIESQNLNPKFKIFIKAIDTDKNLAFLSPFFITGKRNTKNKNLNFHQAKIEKMLEDEKNKKISKKRLKNETNMILLLKIIENHPEMLNDDEFYKLLTSKNYRQYFDAFIRRFLASYKFMTSKYTLLRLLGAFLHNIYYRYISKRQKKALNALKLLDFKFDLKIDDARKILSVDDNIYNFVFLDAFTPAKCPCLWTVDFFKLLYSHLDEDGMILTYSNAANVRSAFLEAGFFVGKIYNDAAGKFMGTVAVKNKSLIKNELSEYDLGLLKTKAGIFYRDENLTGQNEAIIAAHEKEVENSTRISSSKFIKQWKRAKL